MGEGDYYLYTPPFWIGCLLSPRSGYFSLFWLISFSYLQILFYYHRRHVDSVEALYIPVRLLLCCVRFFSRFIFDTSSILCKKKILKIILNMRIDDADDDICFANGATHTKQQQKNEYENEKMTKATTASNDSGGLKSLNGKLGVERQKWWRRPLRRRRPLVTTRPRSRLWANNTHNNNSNSHTTNTITTTIGGRLVDLIQVHSLVPDVSF